MTTYKTVEQEVNKIRLDIYEETKGMTAEQRKERLRKNISEAQREFGFKRVKSARETASASSMHEV